MFVVCLKMFGVSGKLITIGTVDDLAQPTDHIERKALQHKENADDEMVHRGALLM
jgi:hypothetical protein